MQQSEKNHDAKSQQGWFRRVRQYFFLIMNCDPPRRIYQQKIRLLLSTGQHLWEQGQANVYPPHQRKNRLSSAASRLAKTLRKYFVCAWAHIALWNCVFFLCDHQRVYQLEYPHHRKVIFLICLTAYNPFLMNETETEILRPKVMRFCDDG